MRLDAATRIIQYIGRDQETWNALLRSFPEPSYRVQQFSLPAGRWQDSVPSWRCECVLVIDQVEEPEAAKFMEELSRHDAGVPVIALVDSEHPARLTAAGLARLHGVHRLVVKPWPDASALVAAIESAFDWLEHWKKYLRQPLPLSCEPVETLRNAAPTFSLRPEPTVTSAASTASF